MLEEKTVIAAVCTEEEFNAALESKVEILFLLSSNIMTLENMFSRIHQHHKKAFIHVDLAEGIGRDRAGLAYIKKIGADGILSTRTNLIKLAKELELLTVQRFFIFDSRSVDTTIEAAKSLKADFIEVMPGVVPKVIARLKQKIKVPIIAGGLIADREDLKNAFLSGASAVSTSNRGLWEF